MPSTDLPIFNKVEAAKDLNKGINDLNKYLGKSHAAKEAIGKVGDAIKNTAAKGKEGVVSLVNKTKESSFLNKVSKGKQLILVSAGIILATGVFAHIWKKQKEKQGLRDADMAGRLAKMKTGYHIPSDMNYSYDPYSNDGPKNLALTMARNAHRAKGYSK